MLLDAGDLEDELETRSVVGGAALELVFCGLQHVHIGTGEVVDEVDIVEVAVQHTPFHGEDAVLKGLEAHGHFSDAFGREGRLVVYVVPAGVNLTSAVA